MPTRTPAVNNSNGGDGKGTKGTPIASTSANVKAQIPARQTPDVMVSATRAVNGDGSRTNVVGSCSTEATAASFGSNGISGITATVAGSAGLVKRPARHRH